MAEILREICSLSDGATVSSKKDNLVNIGGFLALRDEELARKARTLVVQFEGLHTYGGMSGRDMEALAQGIREMVATDDHVHARVGQVEYLGEALVKAGVPIIQPTGGHGIFIDAMAVLPHIPQDQFPAQALTAALYVESGVRGMERGVVSAGRDKETGEHHYPALELVRLAIPRRVYTQAHMDVTAECVIELVQHPESSGACASPTSPRSCASSRPASSRWPSEARPGLVTPLDADMTRSGAPSSRIGRALELLLTLLASLVFVLLWIYVAAAVLTDGMLLADTWAWLSGLEVIPAIIVWIAILPIGVFVWAWQAVSSRSSSVSSCWAWWAGPPSPGQACCGSACGVAAAPATE